MGWIDKLRNSTSGIRKHAYLRIPVGIFFIILAIIGGFLPIIQGWIFMIIGLTILFGGKFTRHLKELFEKTKKKLKR